MPGLANVEETPRTGLGRQQFRDGATERAIKPMTVAAQRRWGGALATNPEFYGDVWFFSGADTRKVSEIVSQARAVVGGAGQRFDVELASTAARRQGPAVARFFAMSFARISASTALRRPTLPLE